MIGITSYGGYIPRLRIERKIIAKTMAWYQPVIFGAAKGEKSVANWDEDTLTMAVAAAIDCAQGKDRKKVDAVYMASTTMPFSDRLNSDILATAINVNEEGTTCADFTGSQKAGTTALISGLSALKSGDKKCALVAAADTRKTKMATMSEMYLGDGAAALLLGGDDVIAEFIDSHSINCDFIAHYRGAGKEFDYGWEERWIRDEGFGKIIPQAVAGFLKKTKMAIGDFAKIVYPCYFAATHNGIAKKLGITPEQLQSPMHELCGDTGAAHPLLMLVAALETAKPGDKILLAGFGQGCDVLCFKATDKLASFKGPRGVKGHLAVKRVLTSYEKFITFRQLGESDLGIRGEVTPNTSLTVLWRNRKKFIGLVGGKCRKCGTPQFVFTPMCVNPECNAVGEMDPYEFTDKKASVLMYTGDMLAASIDPPAVYGIVTFADGGRMLADFTDCALDDVKVGLPVTMAFRLRLKDDMRGFRGYFWKAVPEIVG
ncbi:MAG: OB-fold domain-containing protein [Spirochaetes bacterium]|nr:OB-fold domain-containing protein [Spirochaetota bacterium]